MKKIIKGSAFISISMAMVLLFSAVNVCTVLAGFARPDNISVESPTWGNVVIASGNLNVRQTASTSSQKVASLPKDSSVMIVGEDGAFYRVQYNTAGNYGYVAKSYIEFRQMGYYLKVNNISGNLNMRSYASTNAEIVAKIPANTSFAYEYDVSDWYCGVYGNKVGAVSKEFVTKYEFK